MALTTLTVSSLPSLLLVFKASRMVDVPQKLKVTAKFLVNEVLRGLLNSNLMFY